MRLGQGESETETEAEEDTYAAAWIYEAFVFLFTCSQKIKIKPNYGRSFNLFITRSSPPSALPATWSKFFNLIFMEIHEYFFRTYQKSFISLQSFLSATEVSRLKLFSQHICVESAENLQLKCKEKGSGNFKFSEEMEDAGGLGVILSLIVDGVLWFMNMKSLSSN